MVSIKKPDIPISSFVKKIADAKKDGPVFLTSGYIGEANDEVLRLYLDLSLETYVEIPRSAVLHVQPAKDGQHERSELLVVQTQAMTLVNHTERTVTPGDIQNAMVQRLNAAQSMANKPPGRVPCSEPQAKADCGCDRAPADAQTKAAAAEDTKKTQPDPLRMAGRIALGPFGFLMDL